MLGRGGVELGGPGPTPDLASGEGGGRSVAPRTFLPEQLCFHFSQAGARAGAWLWFESDLFAFLWQAAAVTGCKGRDLLCT